MRMAGNTGQNSVSSFPYLTIIIGESPANCKGELRKKPVAFADSENPLPQYAAGDCRIWGLRPGAQRVRLFSAPMGLSMVLPSAETTAMR